MVGLVKSFRDLRVYQSAYPLSLEIHKTSLDWPKFEQYGGLADQLRRASKGICANIAEGFAKQGVSRPEFLRFLSIAVGSATECIVWTDYARDLHYIDDATAKTWTETYESIAASLRALRKND